MVAGRVPEERCVEVGDYRKLAENAGTEKSFEHAQSFKH
jgi:hypothetical protein